jgi:hypothetical protein
MPARYSKSKNKRRQKLLAEKERNANNEAISDSFRVEFDDKDSAAYIAVTILRCHKADVKKVPINPETFKILGYEYQDLVRFEREVKDMAASLFYRKQRLRLSCRAMGFDLEGDPNEELDENKKLIKKFTEFTLEGDDVPFFSEAKLYDLLGKHHARDVLGLINTVKKKLDVVEGCA